MAAFMRLLGLGTTRDRSYSVSTKLNLCYCSLMNRE
ncbi:hypothetical protein ALP75_200685 [Pseudomonas syringae pv. actinidiae]|nr:hypothetical protein ALP75_200685 [Pseudomonas syringae pv. actinidiae]